MTLRLFLMLPQTAYHDRKSFAVVFLIMLQLMSQLILSRLF